MGFTLGYVNVPKDEKKEMEGVDPERELHQKRVLPFGGIPLRSISKETLYVHNPMATV